MTFADGWTCRACWKGNRAQDPVCYRCKTPRDADEAEVEAQRKAAEARAQQPEVVPDIVVALPAVVFRGYSKVWMRGGIGVFGLLALMALGGVTDVGWLIVTALLGAGLIVCGLVAGEVSDAMRDRELWAFFAGIGLSVIAVIGSVTAFSVFAPGINPTAVRWGSVIVFGGAGVAALVGLVMMFTHRRRVAAASQGAPPSGTEPESNS
jgi:uncharacterized membrane protein